MGNQILAKRLKLLREEKGFLQKFVADKIGVRSNTLSGYENGTRTPDPSIIAKLAELYNVSTDYLLGRTDARELTIEEKLDKALQLRDGENIYFYDMEGLSDDDIEMLKKQLELYREMSEKRKKEKERRNKSEQG